MSAHVLIADEDQELAAAVGWYLEAEGLRVTVVGEAAAALRACQEGRPQVLVLNEALAAGEGAAELVRLREEQGLLVLLLAARGPAAGDCADDCVTTPCGPMELVARVKALLQRPGATERAPVAIPGLEVQSEERRVLVKGQVVPLSALEYDLLQLFLRQPRVVLSRSQISDALWADDYYGDLRLVDSHVSHLRQKLQAAGLRPCPLVTVRGAGYALRPES